MNTESDSLSYISRTPTDRIDSILERFFLDNRYIDLKSDQRIISVPDEDSSDDYIRIYESSIFEGFTNGSWDEVQERVLEGINLLEVEEPIKVISGNPIEGDDIVNLFDDNDNYIASRYNNRILLFADIDSVSTLGIKKILTTLGFEGMDEAQFFAKKLQNMMRSAYSKSTDEMRRRLDEIKLHQKNAFQSYRSLYDEEMELRRNLDGADDFDEELTERSLKQIERLLRSSYLDSLEFNNKQIVITTKPIMYGFWNIGSYKVTYRPEYDKPMYERLQYPIDNDGGISTTGNLIKSDRKDHPHVSRNEPCSGNWQDQFEQFWRRDMLFGFNLAVRYLRSYNNSSPHQKIEPFLLFLGYINDAEVLLDKKENAGIYIQTIDNGEIIDNFGDTLTEERLREWGCTFEMENDPNRIEEIYVSRCNNRHRDREIINSIEYVPAESEAEPEEEEEEDE